MPYLSRLTLLMLCVFAVGVPASSSHAATSIGALASVRVIYHGLTVRVPHRKPVKGKKKQRLYSQYFLRTLKKQKASIGFRDATVLDLNQLTDAVLHDPKLTIVKRGEIDQIDSAGTHHQVRTATAVASAIGTNFDIRVTGKKAVFIVDQGQVRVQTKRGKVILRRNQESTVVGNGPPSPPQTVDADAAIGWTAPLAGWQVLKRPFPAPTYLTTGPGGNIFVSDFSESRVVGVLPTGRVVATFGSPGKLAGQLNAVAGVAVDKQGNVFVVNGGFVEKFSPQGKHLASIGSGTPNGGPLDFFGAEGLAIDSAGNLYVCDSGESRIQKISPSGKFLNYIDGDTGVPLSHPYDIAFDAAGNGWIADTYAGQIVEISPSGRLLATYGSPGKGRGKFDLPEGIGVAPNGNVWVADTLNSDVQELSPSGQTIMLWGKGTRLPGEFFEPTDVTVDSRGTVYVADNGNKRIQKLNP